MAEMEKIDLFKQFKDEYKAGKKPVIIQTTKAQYLAIDGRGEPGGTEFQECIGALYGMAFTIKMTRKADGLGDYTVCKLESQWFGPDGKELCSLPKDQWHWKLLIRTPDCVKQKNLEKATDALLSKGKEEKVKDVKLEKIHEGKCVQMMHIGPYDQAGDTIAQMQQFEEENGLILNGRYHEIYLSDPRRVEPERLKTIIRRPVK